MFRRSLLILCLLRCVGIAGDANNLYPYRFETSLNYGGETLTFTATLENIPATKWDQISNFPFPLKDAVAAARKELAESYGQKEPLGILSAELRSIGREEDRWFYVITFGRPLGLHLGFGPDFRMTLIVTPEGRALRPSARRKIRLDVPREEADTPKPAGSEKPLSD